MDKVDAHHRVRVEETPGVPAVRSDPPDDSGRMDDVLGICIVESSSNPLRVGEVVLRGPDNDRLGATSLESVGDRPARNPPPR